MSDGGDQSGGRRPARRQPGWVLLTGVLGAACLMIGLIMLAMIQAPMVRQRVTVTAVVFIAAGIVLLPVAWMKRVRPRSKSNREQNVLDADEHGRV